MERIWIVDLVAQFYLFRNFDLLDLFLLYVFLKGLSLLCIIETHPIQYHAPVWRCLEKDIGISLKVIYGSDFSVAGYHDKEFGSKFAWGGDLLSGYKSIFLSTVANGGARNSDEVEATDLKKILKASDFQVVLLVGYSPQFHWNAFNIARKAKIPVIFRGEVTDHAHKRGILKTFLRDLKLRWFYSQCAALLPVGIRSMEHYQRLGFRSKAKHHSPYCVDTTPFQMEESDREILRFQTRQKLGLSESDSVVMYCGKLSPRKGIDLLMDAMVALAKETKKSLVLLLVGDGEQKPELISRSGPDSGVKVIVTGFQQQHELSPFYHASDLFCLPSRKGETWGLVVNEALHHGLPVVVSGSVGCAPDLVNNRETGVVFRSEDVLELQHGIQKILNRGNNVKFRNLCRSVVKDFSVVNAARGISEAYKEVLNSIK